MAGKRIGPPKRPEVEVTGSLISTLSGPWLITSTRPLFERRAQNSRMTLSVPPRARAVTTNTYRMGWAGLTAALYRALRRSLGRLGHLTHRSTFGADHGAIGVWRGPS